MGPMADGRRIWFTLASGFRYQAPRGGSSSWSPVVAVCMPLEVGQPPSPFSLTLIYGCLRRAWRLGLLLPALVLYSLLCLITYTQKAGHPTTTTCTCSRRLQACRRPDPRTWPPILTKVFDAAALHVVVHRVGALYRGRRRAIIFSVDPSTPPPLAHCELNRPQVEALAAGQGRVAVRLVEALAAGQGRVAVRRVEALAAGQGRVAVRLVEALAVGQGRVAAAAVRPRPPLSALRGAGVSAQSR